MMKFKSLFRRGQQSHSSHQKQQLRHRQSQNHNQQQVAPSNQMQALPLEAKSGTASGVAWHSSSTSSSSTGRESNSVLPATSVNSRSNGPSGGGGNRQSQGSTISAKNPVGSGPPVAARTSLPADYIARMQEIERENDILRKERARLEATLRNAANCVDTRRYDEQYAELAYIKVCIFTPNNNINHYLYHLL